MSRLKCSGVFYVKFLDGETRVYSPDFYSIGDSLVSLWFEGYVVHIPIDYVKYFYDSVEVYDPPEI